MEDATRLIADFRERLRGDKAAAFRDWFHVQEELAQRGDEQTCRALADDLASCARELPFPSEQERARFLHNLGVFFGTPGPAADLARARELFLAALAHFERDPETGWQARALHNFATAISNLGTTASELDESIGLFERALEWRTGEREIARAVTLHHMGVALRRAAELDRARSADLLAQSAAAFRDAIEIRARLRLAEGHAMSLFHLALTLEAGSEPEAARGSYLAATERFEELGKTESAGIARRRADALE